MTSSHPESGTPSPLDEPVATTGEPAAESDEAAETAESVEPVEAAKRPAPAGDRVTTSRTDAASLLVQEGDIAGDYLEQLLDIIDFDGDIDMDVEGDRASVAIVGDTLTPLIGPRGSTLDALQELTRLAVLQKTGSRSRLMLDVGGYRVRRRLELVAIAKNTAERVKSQGDAEPMAAMNPFERKVVHDAIAEIDGVSTESEGEEPDRRVVVLPAP